MVRRQSRPAPTEYLELVPQLTHCPDCGLRLWVAYHSRRTVVRLTGLCAVRLTVRWCRNPACDRYHRPIRPEAEGAVALPCYEIGMDVLALVGALRFGQHRAVAEIHQTLTDRGVGLAPRSILNLVYRYEELVALRVGDLAAHAAQLQAQGEVVLALDGMQPDVGHEVLWVLRDCRSGTILLAQSLLSGREAELVGLIQQVQAALPVPITAVISDGQHSIRNAVATALPTVPHQLCQFHYLREAARPVYEADRHAKKELKKHVRGVRPIERAVEADLSAEAQVVRGYCLAVRSALTDDGPPPPLGAAGLRLQERLTAIHDSLVQVAAQRGGCRRD